jgi:hypothetical protein
MKGKGLKMEYFKRVSFGVSLLFVLQLLAAGVTGALAGEKSGRNALDIIATHVDYAIDRAVILGNNFDNGATPHVELGGYFVEVLWHDANSILVSLPGPLEAVDLRLSVVTGPSDNQVDHYDLTFGSTGPQGPQGEQGPQGPTGDVGPQGPKAPTGEQGPQGPQGPIGLTGPRGMVGPFGPAGPEGIEGPPGQLGPNGPVGNRQAHNIRIYNPTATVRALTIWEVATGTYGVVEDFFYECPSGGKLINAVLESMPTMSWIYDEKISILLVEDDPVPGGGEGDILPLIYECTLENGAIVFPPATFRWAMVCAW